MDDLGFKVEGLGLGFGGCGCKVRDGSGGWGTLAIYGAKDSIGYRGHCAESKEIHIYRTCPKQ